ncbi:MAG: NAD-dependent epimerase/dehydratase family protein [Kiritimatiellae bacterium]|nr:NAD-dependent epimerase/dehydratase family protein [Kiritimatiellia bacterium]
MKTVLVTGAKGFIGQNLAGTLLERRSDYTLLPIDIDSTANDLANALATSDFIFHLAGINRPENEREFQIGNADFTTHICRQLLKLKRAVPLVMSSSVQVVLDNPYGVSKRKAEDAVLAYAERSGARVVIYRLKNVFGKWCRPNYNSVVATFCHNIAHDRPVTISDPNREIELIYIDDVVQDFLRQLESGMPSGVAYREIEPVYKVNLGGLAELIRSFREMRRSLYLPDFSGEFARKLYGTFLTYLDTADFGYDLEQKRDPRGCLVEFVKSHPFGQIFISRTHPGITRGNHYHHTKAEKFLVVEGEAIIRFRPVQDGAVIEYRVNGRDLRVVDIPPGYTHSIENVGGSELVTLFWSPEVFNPSRLDTIGMPVIPEK